MDKKNLFDDLQSRVNQIIDNTPIRDVEKNIRALLTQALSRLDMVTSEEFALQAKTIVQLRKQVAALEKRVKTLEGSTAGES
ncbi:MAG: accessory factor UbiK family protein [Burkholderiaceae bacterium]|jgi:BMFP domain-containing protein YqiC|nr:accessory factor UbiK family protein [Burkholderiaceae bacterium]